MIERGVDSTDNDSIKDLVFGFLEKATGPVSTQDISIQLDLPWHSVQTRCLKLQLEERVKGFRIGRMNLWEVKKDA